MTMSYAAPLSSTYWDDDGTPAFEDMLAKIKSDGAVLI